jgi:regulation of enolase protein 1 (concanavalin A-like superfamily)
LESRLGEAEADDERFFYHGQLAMLAILDGRQDDVKAHMQELIKLRPFAGSFAGRIPYIVECAIKIPDEYGAVVERLLKEFQSAPNSNRFALAIRDIEMIFESVGRQDIFLQFCRQLKSEYPEKLEELGFGQLYLKAHQPSGDYASLEIEDTFDSDLLNPVWEWVDPNADCIYELVPPLGVQFSVPPDHDLWINLPNTPKLTAPRLLRTLSGDFAVETRISDGEGGKKSGGLLVWIDGENFIRLDMPSSSMWEGEAHMEFAQSGKWSFAGRGRLSAEQLSLRLERRGDRFTGYLSRDGENWYLSGWVDMAMEDPIQVGIHALCAESPATSTRFEYFRIYRPR